MEQISGPKKISQQIHKYKSLREKWVSVWPEKLSKIMVEDGCETGLSVCCQRERMMLCLGVGQLRQPELKPKFVLNLKGGEKNQVFKSQQHNLKAPHYMK